MRRVLIVAIVSVLVSALGLPASAGVPPIYPPGESPLGMSYPEWSGSYNIWLQEIPRGQNPLFHPDSPRNCEIVDGAIFLGGLGADCDVPAGMPVMFATAAWECSTAEGLGQNFRRLRRCAKRNFRHDFGSDVFQQRVIVDGQRIHADRQWIFLTPGEIVDFPERNIWRAEPGPSKSVTKGFHFMLSPLSAGDHRIRVRILESIFGRFAVVWRLHVT